MITIVAGTNRPDSNSRVIANHYCQLLEDMGSDAQILALEDLPHDFVYRDVFGELRNEMSAIRKKYVEGINKFVFVIPEYNGGFPGVLKSFIDAIPPADFYGKKAGLIGVSSGQAGSLRPMDQFTNVLNYLRVNVLYAKPKLSNVMGLIDDNGVLTDDRAIQQLREQAELMVKF